MKALPVASLEDVEVELAIRSSTNLAETGMKALPLRGNVDFCQRSAKRHSSKLFGLQTATARLATTNTERLVDTLGMMSMSHRSSLA